MEFLISLSTEAKEKLATTSSQNKSVMYSDYVLNEEDAKWVHKMKLSITDYIKNSHADGPYFLRMIDTILARDKNWVRWKVESCPSIEIPAVTARVFAEAKESVRKAFLNKRMRPAPMGALPLDFLASGDDDSALDKFKSSDRHALPELESFKDMIAEEDLEIDMPRTDQSRADAIERKASKTWRALRIASRTKMSAFDRIEDDSRIDAVFAAGSQPAKMAADPESLPTDARPVIISGPRGAGKTSVAKMLAARNPNVFGEVLRHTTRQHQSQDLYNFVEAKDFNIMVDGDRFIEFSEVDGHMYGTSRGSVDAIRESGQVPLIQLNAEVSCPFPSFPACQIR